MITDPVVEKLHKQREEYMERFQYDLDAIVRDIKAREASNPGPLLQPPPDLPLHPRSAPGANRALRGRGR
jgi:hypothetical protein